MARFWQMACGLGLPAAAAVAAAHAQVVQNAGNPGASLALALGGGFFAAAGGIWGNLYAGRRQKQDDAEEAERARLFNHDMAKAVARSIATLLEPLANDGRFALEERSAVGVLIGRAEGAWLSVAEAEDPLFAPILEGQLAEAVTINPDEPALGPYGDDAMWREVIRRMAQEADSIDGKGGEGTARLGSQFAEGNELLKAAVHACREGFGRQFFNDLKHDFATKGQAFAAVHLRMMGELVTLARTQAKSNTEIHAKLDAIAEAVNRRGEKVVAWIGEDEGTGAKRLASLRPITSWLKSIDVKLADIDRKANDILERLKRIEKQGVRTEQVVCEGFGKARKSEAEAHGGTRRRLRVWIGGTAAIVLMAVTVTYGLVSSQARRQHAEQMALLAAVTGILDSNRGLPPPMLDADGKVVTSAPAFTNADRVVAKKAAASGDPLTRAKAAIIAGKPVQARAELERIADPLKPAVDYLTAMGDSFYFEERYDEAVPYYENALSLLEPTPNPEAILVLAIALASTQRDIVANTQRAIDLYTRAIELPIISVGQLSSALNNRGTTHATQGQLQEAIADYTRAIDLPGAEAELVTVALVNRGFTRAQQGRPEEAIADYTRALNTAGATADAIARALNYRGFTFVKQGRLGEGIADYTHAIQLPGATAQQRAWAFNNRGFVHAQQGRMEEALADSTHAIELFGAQGEHAAMVLNNRGYLHTQMRRPEEAIADFTRVIALVGAPAEEVAIALYNRGCTHLRQGRPEEAIVDCTRAIELPGASEEQVALALANRGASYATLGRTADACSDLAEAARLFESTEDVTRTEQVKLARQQLGCS